MPERLTKAERRRQQDYAWQVVKWWGQRSSIKARFRTVRPLFEQLCKTFSLVDRVLALVVPWDAYSYPGRHALIAAVCGVRSKATIGRWRKHGIPPAQCERLARFLESRVERELAMIAELRTAAERAEASKLAPYLARPLEIDERWRLQRLAQAARRKRKAEKAVRAARMNELPTVDD